MKKQCKASTQENRKAGQASIKKESGLEGSDRTAGRRYPDTVRIENGQGQKWLVLLLAAKRVWNTYTVYSYESAKALAKSIRYSEQRPSMKSLIDATREAAKVTA